MPSSFSVGSRMRKPGRMSLKTATRDSIAHLATWHRCGLRIGYHLPDIHQSICLNNARPHGVEVASQDSALCPGFLVDPVTRQ